MLLFYGYGLAEAGLGAYPHRQHSSLLEVLENPFSTLGFD
jgi:hypothetical protein